jgi:hypothetical protein
LDIACTPAYYRRASDELLVPVTTARWGEDFYASGVVLTIVKPDRLRGQILALHFDGPGEKWDNWYKPDILYSGTINTNWIGGLFFMCDPGLRTIGTNDLVKPRSATP